MDEALYKKKEFLDDTVLNMIMKKYISLKDDHIKKSNELLQQIIEKELIPLMREDPLFKETYRNIYYTGSFFKGTKVGKPDEYDLDLRIHLPLNYRTLKVETNHDNHGYVKIKVDDFSKLPKWETHGKLLNKWTNEEGYLNQNRFRQWMERVMTKTFDRLKKCGQHYELSFDNKAYILKEYKKNGPAFTIHIEPKYPRDGDEMMDVDLVPCLEFDDIVLNGYRQIINMSRKLVVVAKPSNELGGNCLWRLSFYDQEKRLLQDTEVGKLKPIIRLIKKLRDKFEWKQIRSYYIETLFLHEICKRRAKKDAAFFRAPKTCLFIYMLRKLFDAIDTRNLPYFWHENHNLLSDMKTIVCVNYRNQLGCLLNRIENKISTNKLIIAEYIYTYIPTYSTQMSILGPPKTNENGNFYANEDSIREMLKGTSVSSCNSTVLKNRINFVCEELAALSTLKNELSYEDKERLIDSCSLWSTLPRQVNSNPIDTDNGCICM